jgi:superoxide dismutase, Cu-Zn family
MKRTLAVLSGVVLLVAATAGVAQKRPSATVKLEPSSGTNVNGTLRFTQVGARVRIHGQLSGHTPGPKGFHIHEKGDCSDPKAMSAGGHFNPHGKKHGGPGAKERHAGDLGNLVFDQDGKVAVDITVDGLLVSRSKPDGVIGRAVIVHLERDDLKSDPTGNAGGRAACGVIGG